MEADLENISQAKECLKKAKELQRLQPWVKSGQEVKKIFSEAEGFIKYKERDVLARIPLHPPLTKGGVGGLEFRVRNERNVVESKTKKLKWPKSTI